jgi:transposase
MRARVVLLSADGHSLREIAERLGVTQRTVCLWRRRYQGEGWLGSHE